MRTATITRNTAETRIELTLNLDGSGSYDNQTGVGFFDHMLDQLARHSLIDLTLRRMQYQCVKVYSGEDAARLIVNRRFDLILLDYEIELI